MSPLTDVSQGPIALQMIGPKTQHVDTIESLKSPSEPDGSKSVTFGPQEWQSSNRPAHVVNKANPASDEQAVCKRCKRLQSGKDEMLARGWCIHQVDYLSKIYDEETFSYLAKLDRSSQRTADHTRCIGQPSCIAYNADLALYHTRHTTEGCTCQIIPTPYGELVKTIRKGRIPLISFQGGEQHNGETPELRIHHRRRNSKYVAISHVWADGLGNPSLNGLPLCQLKQLETHLRALQAASPIRDGPLLFWMDTLCIPVHQEHNDLRLTQIDKMASIYQGAYCCLALDAELMDTTCPTGVTSLELRARIACSVWMCRSWTLQEGVLPRCIVFQFLGGALVLGFSGDGEIEESWTEPTGPAANTSSDSEETHQVVGSDGETATKWNVPSRISEDFRIKQQLLRNFRSTFFREIRHGPLQPTLIVPEEFVWVWNVLAGRSTTMPEDTPIILTNTLDVQNRKLFKCRDSGEMLETIIFSLDRIPLSIFFSACRRRDERGKERNWWVPAEIGNDLLTNTGLMEIRKNYLLYEYLRHRASGISIYSVDALTPTAATYYFRTGGDNDSIFAVEPLSTARDDFRVRGFAGTCLIIEDSTPWTTVLPEKRGACFYVTKSRQGRRRNSLPRVEMEFQCPVRVRKCSDAEGLKARGLGPLYNASAVLSDCDFKISRDPIRCFRRLKTRKTEHLRYPVISAVLAFAIWSYIFFKVVWHVNNAVAAGFIFVAFVIGSGIVFSLVVYLWIKINHWNYVRSFESPSSKRFKRGAIDV